MLLQALRAPLCTLPDVSASSSSSSSEPPPVEQQQQQQHAASQAVASTGMQTTTPLNFDDIPAQEMQHTNQQQVVPLRPAPKPSKPLKAKAFQIPAQVFSAMQQTTTGSDGSSSVALLLPPTSSGAVSLLLPHIAEQHEQLAAWQTNPWPSYDELVQYDRLKLSGGQQQQGGSSSSAGRVSEAAFRERYMLIKKFGSKGLLRTLAVDYSLQLPKQVRCLAANIQEHSLLTVVCMG